VVVGRIFVMPVAPEGRPWMWASGDSAATMKRAALDYERRARLRWRRLLRAGRGSEGGVYGPALAWLYPVADFRVSCQLRRVGCPCALHHSLRSSTAS
jgi:hypothetical protein